MNKENLCLGLFLSMIKRKKDALYQLGKYSQGTNTESWKSKEEKATEN